MRVPSSKRSLLVTIVSIILLSVCAPLQAKESSRASAMKDVRIFQQMNQTLGPMTLYIADDAAKFSAHAGDLLLVSKAPSWKVVAFCKSQNKGAEFSLEQWLAGKGLGLLGSKAEFRKGTQSEIIDPLLKLDCLIVQVRGTDEKEFLGSEEPLLFRSVKKKTVLRNRFMRTKSITIKKEVQEFLSGVYNQKDFDGVPLELARDFTDGAVDRGYFTSSVSKSKMPEEFFAYPKGFNNATMTDILISKKQQANLKDYFDVLLAPDSSTIAPRKK